MKHRIPAFGTKILKQILQRGLHVLLAPPQPQPRKIARAASPDFAIARERLFSEAKNCWELSLVVPRALMLSGYHIVHPCTLALKSGFMLPHFNSNSQDPLIA